MRATALGEALLAEMGGLKVAMAEAAPPVAQNFSGVWDKVAAPSQQSLLVLQDVCAHTGLSQTRTCSWSGSASEARQLIEQL
jgi:hypothetical protein